MSFPESDCSRLANRQSTGRTELTQIRLDESPNPMIGTCLRGHQAPDRQLARQEPDPRVRPCFAGGYPLSLGGKKPLGVPRHGQAFGHVCNRGLGEFCFGETERSNLGTIGVQLGG